MLYKLFNYRSNFFGYKKESKVKNTCALDSYTLEIIECFDFISGC